MLKKNIKTLTAFAPATCANVAVGFDLLGFAIKGVGDTVMLTRRDDKQVVITQIDCDETLPMAADENTASAVVKYLCDDLQLASGFSLHIKKGLPLSAGMGGSAASAVAALVACNAFLEKPLPLTVLARYALQGEQVAVGQAHSDNVIPCLFGGLTLTHSLDPIGVINLPIPDVYAVIVHPHLKLETKKARAALPEYIKLVDHITQSAYTATFIAALYQHDLSLLQQSLVDMLIEPHRAPLVTGFDDVKNAALKAGALGASLSGSGPSVFALARNKNEADTIAASMQAAFEQHNVASDQWISNINPRGAYLVDET